MRHSGCRARLGMGLALLGAFQVWGANGEKEAIHWNVATDSPAVFLERLAKAVEGKEPKQRLLDTGPEAVVFAAASAAELGGGAPAKWGAKLYGEGTDGKRGFDIAGELVAGTYTRMLDLPVALGRMEYDLKRTTQWGDIAVALEKAAGKDAARAGWRKAAAAFRMLALWRNARTPAQRTEQVDAFAAADAKTKQGIVDAIARPIVPKARRQPTLPPQQVLNRLLGIGFGLRYQRYFSKRLEDPTLGELFGRTCRNPRAVGALLGQMAGHAPAARAAMSKAQAQATTAKVKGKGKATSAAAVLDTVSIMLRANQRAEAIALLREFEPRCNYPERQMIRRRLLGLLGGRVRPPMGGRPSRAPQVLAQDSPLGQEWAKRQAAKGLVPGELALIRADIHGAARLRAEAAGSYADALDEAEDAAIKQAAWESWAAYEPKEAWRDVGKVDALLADQKVDIKSRARLACRAVAIGLSVGDVAGTCAWGQSRLAPLNSTQDGASAQAACVLWGLLAPPAEGEEPKPLAEADLSGLSDRGRFWLAHSSFSGCSNQRVSLAGGSEDRKLNKHLRAQLKARGGWDAALALATAAAPHSKDGRTVATLWGTALRTCPPLGKSLTDEKRQAETRRQQALATFTTQCLKVLGSVEKRTASLTGGDFLSAAANAVGGGQGKRFLPHCQALCSGTLAKAKALGCSPYSSSRHLKMFARGLRKCGATDADMARFQKEVATAFAGQSQLDIMLKELAAASKP